MAQNWIIDRGLLLMDEPFSALDVHTRQRMETELLSLWDESGSSRTLPERAPPDAMPASLEMVSRPRDVGAELAPPGDRPRSAPPGGVLKPLLVSRLSQTSRKTVIFVTHDLEEAIALADDVVVLSAGPAARVVARHPVTLARPRDLLELRTAPEFIDLYRAIWAVLRGEVIKSQQTRERSRG
jgi:ABC-type nitrate/sulfonate/bicarbonate transport system ATPase subunit